MSESLDCWRSLGPHQEASALGTDCHLFKAATLDNLREVGSLHSKVMQVFEDQSELHRLREP